MLEDLFGKITIAAKYMLKQRSTTLGDIKAWAHN